MIRRLVSIPGLKVVVNIRGEPDDVALDEMAEVDESRSAFVRGAVDMLTTLGAHGMELEWHSDDPGGGKPTTSPFDAMEQYHLALLCKDLSGALRTQGGTYGRKTLSVAVRPGRKEFEDGRLVNNFVDWLSVRAYSMKSLGDPHHASIKDMHRALDEWTSRGVSTKSIVLVTPLFGRPGSALHTPGGRDEALRKSWAELSQTGLTSRAAARSAGDAFHDAETGKVWWASGVQTTREKMRHLLERGYKGIAFRDLHQDSPDPATSLVKAAGAAAGKLKAEQQRRWSTVGAAGAVLFQRGMRRTKTAVMEEGAEL